MHSSASAASISDATRSVFSTMLDLEVQPGESYVETAPSPSSEGVVALIGLAGEWSGTGSLTCSAAFACQIASRMLMTELRPIDGDVLDAVAEIANMIIGNVKAAMEDELGPMGMSIPTIIFGKNFSARTAGKGDWLTVPFQCLGERLEVKLCLAPNRFHRGTPVTSYALQGVGCRHTTGG